MKEKVKTKFEELFGNEGEIKEYFAEQLMDYKKKELAEVNERLTDSFKSIAEKDATINSLSRTIDEYKIKVIKLENNYYFWHIYLNVSLY